MSRLVIYIYYYFYALLSTNSMYSAIVHYITKTYHMPQQEGTKEREKNKIKKNRGYISISLHTDI